MATRKVAITVPPAFLKRVDGWAKKMGKPRSRFIVEEMEKRLDALEDEQITMLYDQAFGNDQAAGETKALAEEMLTLAALPDAEGQW